MLDKRERLILARIASNVAGISAAARFDRSSLGVVIVVSARQQFVADTDDFKERMALATNCNGCKLLQMVAKAFGS